MIYFVILTIGVILWSIAHNFKRILPTLRTRIGDASRGMVAVLLVVSLVLIVIGYRSADVLPLWTPPAWAIHVNNLLMLAAFWTFGSSAAKGAKAFPANKVRHPQLTAVMIWATAHLLANGDLASFILFGGMLAWAMGSVFLINKAEPNWTVPEHAPEKTYIRLGIITLVFFSITTGLHNWLGVWPFPS